MDKQNKICRFCLENCDNNFTLIEENATKIFHLLKLAIDEAVMCLNCTECVKDWSNFKSISRGVEDFIVQFINCKDSNVKLDLKDIYSCKEARGVPEGHDICRLCMDSLQISSFVSLDGEGEGIMLEKMITECLPDLNIRVIERPLICVTCQKSLQYYFRFITNCFIIEEKIKKYCESVSGDSTSVIKLKDVLEFTTKNLINNIDGIKMEVGILCGNENRADKQKFSNVPCTSDDIVTNKDAGKIKVEAIFLEEVECKTELKSENLNKAEQQQFTDAPKFAIKCEEVDVQFEEIKIKHSYGYAMEHEPKLKQDSLNSLQDVLPPTETNNDIPEMQKCPVEQPHRTFPHLQLVTSGKKYRNRHLAADKNSPALPAYQCEHCSFRTKYSRSLNVHLLMHKNPSEVTMNRCDFCSFQTKYKSHLKRHLLTHKKPSEITMYQCKHCSFQTKRKENLTNHLPYHEILPEIYQCERCSFQAKHGSSLKNHLLTHKSPSEIIMYRCEHCSFQTKYKGCQKKHLLSHKSLSEITIYPCKICSFKTKYKCSLKKHLQCHENPSKITMYHCEHCLFQARDKGNLKNHLLSHTSKLERTMFQCEHCSFQTKRKHCLKEHLLNHKDPSEITMFHCEHCSFQTKHLKGIKKHLQCHKDHSEITMT